MGLGCVFGVCSLAESACRSGRVFVLHDDNVDDDTKRTHGLGFSRVRARVLQCYVVLCGMLLCVCVRHINNNSIIIILVLLLLFLSSAKLYMFAFVICLRISSLENPHTIPQQVNGRSRPNPRGGYSP